MSTEHEQHSLEYQDFITGRTQPETIS